MCGSPGGQQQSSNEAEGEQSGERLAKNPNLVCVQATVKCFLAFLTRVGAQARFLSVFFSHVHLLEGSEEVLVENEVEVQ